MSKSIACLFATLMLGAGFTFAERPRDMPQQGLSSQPGSPTPEEIIAEMDRLVAAYPRICVKRVYGKSVKGVQLAALKISDNPAEDEDEPEILFDGGIHGDESIATDLIMRFVNRILTGYGIDAGITKLIDSREIWFYCMVNPDGREKSRENANGIDLNRDYGYMKVGAFTQPESRGVRDCLLENQFALQFSYHAGIEYLLYPWCFSPSLSPDKALHSFLADLYSTTSGYYDKSKNVQSYFDYKTDGETIDYAYGVLGTAALTMEVAVGNVLLPKYYAAGEPAMLKMIEYAGYGLEGAITDAKTGQGVAAIVTVNDYMPFYSDPKAGDYHKFVPAGTYAIKVTANGYLPQTIPAVTAPASGAVRTNMRLEPDPAAKSTFAYRVIYAEPGIGKPQDLTGPPDNRTFTGVVVVDLQNPVADQPGMEFRLHASGTAQYACFAGAAPDGPWAPLGTGSGATRDFDLSAAGLPTARYLKVTGGASLDAVEVLRAPVVSLDGIHPGSAGYAGRSPGSRPRLEVDLARSRVYFRLGESGPGKDRAFDARGSRGDGYRRQAP